MRLTARLESLRNIRNSFTNNIEEKWKDSQLREINKLKSKGLI